LDALDPPLPPEIQQINGLIDKTTDPARKQILVQQRDELVKQLQANGAIG
jgi:hypothetical protein